MIAEALQREAESACYTGGFAVTISIEGGEEVAKRTFNPHIGVEDVYKRQFRYRPPAKSAATMCRSGWHSPLPGRWACRWSRTR